MRFPQFYFSQLTIFLILLGIFNLRGQEAEQQEYQLLWEEASLMKKLLSHARDTTLLDSAKTYANQGDFFIASVFVEQFIAENSLDQSKAATIESNPENQFIFSIHTGLDFNRQEFEVGYIQTDSVLSEQLRKPYLSLQVLRNWQIRPYWATELNYSTRYDKENFTTLLSAAQTLRFSEQTAKISTGIEYDKNYLYPEFTYLAFISAQTVQWTFGPKWMLQLDNSIRYKKYSHPSLTIPSYFNNHLIANFSHYAATLSSWQLEYGMEWNESIDCQNNDYQRYNLDIYYNSPMGSTWGMNHRIGWQRNHFKYILTDSLFDNTSQSLSAQLRNIFYLSHHLNLLLEYQGKYKSYIKKTEQEPDYYWHQLDFAVRSTYFNHVNFEFGIRHELKKHRIFPGAQEIYIQEQNFYGNGILFGIESGDYNSYLLTLSMAYTFRRYPEAQADDVLNIYSNRNILNVTLFGQIPVYHCINIGIIASYDNDQDLDRDESNTRNSFFSFDIEYKF